MAPDEYSKALDKALSDLQQGVQQRDILHADIAGLRETVRVLSTLVQMPTEKRREVAKLIAMADYATPSLTDAIRSLLLRMSPKEMTAIEVRNALEDSSDYEGISLSACHAALKRMLSDEEIESGPIKNGKASYRRVIKLPEPSDPYGGIVGIISASNLPPRLRTLRDLAGLSESGALHGAKVPAGASDHPINQMTQRKTLGQRIAEQRTQKRMPPPPDYKDK